MQETNRKYHVDWMFLLFLAGATYVKLYIKILAVLIYLAVILYRKYIFRRPVSAQVFYLLMPLAGLPGAFFGDSFLNSSYWAAFTLGTTYWLLAGAISYLLYIACINIPSRRLQDTLKIFFGLNALVSLAELGKMIIDSGHLVPYWDWGPNMYYGGATGDHILGLTGNISVNNAMITATGVLYFVFQKNIRWAALCLVISILCTSNLTLLILLAVLVAMLLLIRDRKIRLYSFYMLLLSGIIYPLLTYDNIRYAGQIYTADIKTRELSPEERQKIQAIRGREWKEPEKYEINADLFKGQPVNYYYIRLDDSFALARNSTIKYMLADGGLKRDPLTGILDQGQVKQLINEWYSVPHEQMPLSTFHKPVKIYSFLQTLHFMSRNTEHFLFGAGMGNFSSKQAVKTTGFGLQGSYPLNKIYISGDFLRYHMYTLLYVLAMPAAEHSILNMPNSIYNQVGGEYGLLGVLLFLGLYVMFFLKKYKRLHWSMYIVAFIFVCLGFEYWFEMISLTVIFELIMFMKLYGAEHATPKE